MFAAVRQALADESDRSCKRNSFAWGPSGRLQQGPYQQGPHHSQRCSAPPLASGSDRGGVPRFVA
eukprot:9135192-Alexandrium_andersonii.AAC.1